VAALAMSAFAQSSHGRYGGFVGTSGGGGFGPGLGGGGFWGHGGYDHGGIGFGIGGPWMHGPVGGGGGVFFSDVLTPAASFLGFSSASALASELNSSGKTLAQEATAKNKTADDLIKAIVAAQKTNLDNEKAAGWITADQETALLQVYTDEVTALVNNGPGVPNGGGAQATGPLQTAATFVGMSVADVVSALQSGKSLADLAKSKGKSPDDLVQALIAPAKANLDQAVKDGKITSAQEQTIITNLTTQATNFVNGTKPSSTKTSSLQQSVIRFASVRSFAFLHR
jgi:hypothetical protein